LTHAAVKRKPLQVPTGTDSRPAAGSGGTPLGIVTKNSSPCFYGHNPDTGEAIPIETKSNGKLSLVKRPEAARAERWALKAVVNQILKVPATEKQHRTTKCMIMRQPIAGFGLAPIQVHKTANHGKAFYTGLMACGSIWNCPVCASKVSERRREELKTALESARRIGWKIHFVTLTVPHGIGDDLSKMKELQQKALTKLSSGKNSIKSQLSRAGIDQYGYIRAYEVTHGKQNGFHPHFHILLFTSPNVTHQVIEGYYKNAWQNACVRVGLPRPSDEHGCTVQDGTYAAEYASKWGIEDEMTKANTKLTKRKGKTPFGLLKAVLEETDPDYPPEYAARLFKVYSKCMTGARQLHWSVGLRAKLALAPEMTDEQLAEQITDETARHLATITLEQWKAISKAGAQAHILTVAESLTEGTYHILFEIINGYFERQKMKEGGEGAPLGKGGRPD